MEFHASLQSRRGEESWTSRRSSAFSSWFPTSSSSGLHLALFPRSRRMVVSWLAVFGVRPEEGPIQQRSKGAQTVTDNSTIARAARSASADHSTIPWASTRTKLPAAIASAKTSRCRLVKAMAGDGKHGILNRWRIPLMPQGYRFAWFPKKVKIASVKPDHVLGWKPREHFPRSSITLLSPSLCPSLRRSTDPHVCPCFFFLFPSSASSRAYVSSKLLRSCPAFAPGAGLVPLQAWTL